MPTIHMTKKNDLKNWIWEFINIHRVLLQSTILTRNSRMNKFGSYCSQKQSICGLFCSPFFSRCPRIHHICSRNFRSLSINGIFQFCVANHSRQIENHLKCWNEMGNEVLDGILSSLSFFLSRVTIRQQKIFTTKQRGEKYEAFENFVQFHKWKRWTINKTTKKSHKSFRWPIFDVNHTCATNCDAVEIFHYGTTDAISHKFVSDINFVRHFEDCVNQHRKQPYTQLQRPPWYRYRHKRRFTLIKIKRNTIV